MLYTEPTIKFLKSNYLHIMVAASALSLTLAFGAVLSAHRTMADATAISVALADTNAKMAKLRAYAWAVECDRAALAAKLADAQNEVVRAEQDLAGFHEAWQAGRSQIVELSVRADSERTAREVAEKKLRRRVAAASPRPMVLAQH